MRRIFIENNRLSSELTCNPKKPSPKSCTHRGDQLRTMTSDLCGTRGHDLPVYSCAVYGECTHRQVCKGQDEAVRICVGCSDGPWAF